MQIELIETFIDLAETKSFNRSAERLGVTQSTVSGRVQALEKLLDRKLFTRSRAGTELTIEGSRFAPHARSLRLAWAEAIHAARDAGVAAMMLRIGMQHDLVGASMADWVAAFRTAFPQAAFYVEADYSNQMCDNLMSGELDISVLYSPKARPDLHFETLGEVRYVMVSTATARLEEIEATDYIRGAFSPAFDRAHAERLPTLSAARVSCGQEAAVVSLLRAGGGAAYVRQETALQLVAEGMHQVGAAPSIPQSVFAAVHLRNRHRPAHRRLLQMLRAHFSS
jgi:DNA-binding transcriptional LysR family regulator